MELISKAEFSRVLKVSAPYVDKICKAGKVTLIQDGKKQKVDLHGSKTLKFLSSRDESGRVVAKQKPQQVKDNSIETEQTFVPSGNNPSGLPGDSEEIYGLKDTKLSEQIEKLRIENQQKRGALIDKKLVTNVFDRLAGIDENQFKSLAVRVGPRIEESLADSYDNKTTEILLLLGRESDTDLKTDIQKIMNAGASDRIRKVTEIIEEDTGSVLKNIQYEFGKFLERCEI